MTSYNYSVISVIIGVVGFLWQMGSVLFKDRKPTLQGLALVVFALFMAWFGVRGLQMGETEKRITETLHTKKMDSVSRSIQTLYVLDSTRFAKIDSSLKKRNLAISGDSVMSVDLTFTDNHSINVTSSNQKGGQTGVNFNNSY